MSNCSPEDGVPFKNIVLTGLIRDEFGKKMSKSRGNTVDPLDWMDTYGTDALRFTLARGAIPGADVPIGAEWVQGSRNFCNKIWNAARFALMNDVKPPLYDLGHEGLSTVDRWILSRLSTVISEVDTAYEQYHFGKVCDILYHFAWDELFDWYIELAKTAIGQGGRHAANARVMLGHVLAVTLRLLHPIIPFVTEELWLAVTGNRRSL